MPYILKSGETAIAESAAPITYVDEQFGWQVDAVVYVDPDRAWVVEPPVVVPSAVSPYQARAALFAAGLLDEVETAVTAAGGQTKIAWEYAATIERHSAFITAMQPVLGMTGEQVDDLFIAASAIT